MLLLAVFVTSSSGHPARSWPGVGEVGTFGWTGEGAAPSPWPSCGKVGGGAPGSSGGSARPADCVCGSGRAGMGPAWGPELGSGEVVQLLANSCLTDSFESLFPSSSLEVAVTAVTAALNNMSQLELEAGSSPRLSLLPPFSLNIFTTVKRSLQLFGDSFYPGACSPSVLFVPPVVLCTSFQHIPCRS